VLLDDTPYSYSWEPPPVPAHPAGNSKANTSKPSQKFHHTVLFMKYFLVLLSGQSRSLLSFSLEVLSFQLTTA
jgi:hypothetical protein